MSSNAVRFDMNCNILLFVSHTFSAISVDNQTCKGVLKPGTDAPPRPAPPRGKTGCPAPPRPAKWTKSAGRSGAKLTEDFIDTPFYYTRD